MLAGANFLMFLCYIIGHSGCIWYSFFGYNEYKNILGSSDIRYVTMELRYSIRIVVVVNIFTKDINGYL